LPQASSDDALLQASEEIGRRVADDLLKQGAKTLIETARQSSSSLEGTRLP
jgi:hypothetical protein